MCKKLVSNHQWSWEKLVLNCHRCQWQNYDELEANAKSSGMGGGYLINVRKTHVWNIKVDFVRNLHKVWDIGTSYVTYWYRFFHVLWGIGTHLHSVKFTKCEICGWTKRIGTFRIYKGPLTVFYSICQNSDSMWPWYCKTDNYNFVL